MITVVTSTPSGTVFYIGAAQCQILDKGINGISFVTEATDGCPNTNAPIVQNDPSCMGIFAIPGGVDFLNGKYAYMPGTVLDKLKLVMTGNTSTIQFVTLKNSGITSLKDLKDKRIAMPPAGSVSYMEAELCFEKMGYKKEDFAVCTPMSNSDMADALKDGTMDVSIFSGGTPMAAVSELNSTRDIVLLELPDNILNSILEENTGYVTQTISGDIYSDLTEELVLLGCPMGLFCNADMDDDLVYEITKILNESTEELSVAHAEGAKWNTENTLVFYNAESSLFHPGAARYYDEIQGK